MLALPIITLLLTVNLALGLLNRMAPQAFGVCHWFSVDAVDGRNFINVMTQKNMFKGIEVEYDWY